MNSIIAISTKNINGAEVNSVNAREIHSYLGVRTFFSNWIKRAIKKYDFIEGVDFTVAKNGNKLNQGVSKPFIDYIVTMDMAKELSMLENNSKGKETRKYFISAEKDYIKSLKNNPGLDVIKAIQPTLELMAQGMGSIAKTQEQILEVLKSQAPRVQNNTKINNSRTFIYEKNMHKSQATEIFIDAVRDILAASPYGLNQEVILNTLGRIKADKLSIQRLHDNIGKHWDITLDGTAHIYTLIRNPQQ